MIEYSEEMLNYIKVATIKEISKNQLGKLYGFQSDLIFDISFIGIIKDSLTKEGKCKIHVIVNNFLKHKIERLEFEAEYNNGYYLVDLQFLNIEEIRILHSIEDRFFAREEANLYAVLINL